MSDFTVFDVAFPAEAKQRVIVNTDAKIRGRRPVRHCACRTDAVVRPARSHSGPLRDQEDGYEPSGQPRRDREAPAPDGFRRGVRVEDGAPGAIPDESTPVDSPGARLIVEEAMKDDPRPLHVAFYGPLTDMASALLIEPRVAEQNILPIARLPLPLLDQSPNFLIIIL